MFPLEINKTILHCHGHLETLCMLDKTKYTGFSSSSSCSGRIRFDSCSLYPQNEIGPSISFSVILCVFVFLVYIVVLVQVSFLCASSVCVVATFPGTILFPLLYSLLLFFPWLFNLTNWWYPNLNGFHNLRMSENCMNAIMQTGSRKLENHWIKCNGQQGHDKGIRHNQHYAVCQNFHKIALNFVLTFAHIYT